MADRNIAAIRYKLIMDKPYLTTAALALTPIKSEHVPTMAVTPNWRLYYNQAKINEWTFPECVAVLEHEIWHLLRDHFGRFKEQTAGRDQDEMHLVNVAVDLEINDDIQGLPHPGQFPKEYNFPEGELAEEYYHRLKKLPPQQGSQPNCGSGAHGVPQDWESPGDQQGQGDGDKYGPGVSPMSAEAIRKQTAKAIQSAARGTVPAGLELWANKELEGPKLNWKQKFKRKVRKAESVIGQDDYMWGKPSRRSEAFAPFFVPSLREFKPEVGVIFDTSGSMSYDNRIGKAMKQIQDMLTNLGKRLTIMCCDAAVYEPQHLTSVKQLRIRGGGGTSMTVGIEAMAKQKVDLVVVVTDGETDWPEHRIRQPCIAVIVSDSRYGEVPSWMKTIRVKTNEIHD